MYRITDSALGNMQKKEFRGNSQKKFKQKSSQMFISI